MVFCLGLTLEARATEATLVADAHVSSDRPTVNCGALSNLNVGGGYTSLLQFDLGLLPAGTTAPQVSRAVLRMYVNRADVTGTVSVQPVNGAWSEGSLTYATLPLLGSAVQTVSINQAGGYVAVDVTAQVQGWVTAPATNHGLALTTATAVLQFDSKENDQTAHPASLDVTLVSQGAVGPAGASGAAGPAGPPGAQGAVGPPGAQGPIGPAGAAGKGLQYQGNYGSGVTYALNDVAVYAGSSYLSLVAQNRGNTPGASPAQWGLLAAGGTGTSGNPSVAVSYQGTYASTTNYALNDIVLYGSSSYISLVAQNHGNTPNVSPQWGVLAQGGTGVGPAGPSGPAGPQGPQGNPGLGYAGTYASTTNYAMNDVVTFQGSSYISLVPANVGNTPGQTPGRWGVLAQGSTGPQGPTGLTGPQGPAGFTGPQGPQGLAGTPGVAGATGPQGLPGLTYQGTYQSTANYKVGDVTLWQGATYSSLVAGNHENTPDASPGSWGILSQRGATGAVGTTGAAGPQGPQGLPGSVGPPGDRGPQGMQGLAGQAGAQGLTGATGAQGLSGPAGPQGVAGPVGMTFRGPYRSTVNYALADGVSWQGSSYVSLIAGNAGNTPDQSPGAWSLFAVAGAPGATGTAGPTGATGLTGATGPAGPQGVPGTPGATGPQGPSVVNYMGTYASTTNYASRDAVSFAGSTFVSMIDGNHGNTPGQTAGEWQVLVSQGTTGATGATGAPGATGAVGAVGPAGPAGATGPPLTFGGGWLTGTAYPVGTAVSYGGSSYVALTPNTGRQPDISPQYWGLEAQAGAAGPVGPAGPTGLQGPTGYPGPQGATGATGPSGPAGTAGPVGATGTQGTVGPAGPQGVAGPSGLAYRGAYAAATTYALNDGVVYGGTTYLSLAAGNHANQPDISPGFWGLLAQAGGTGSAGATGAAGPQGVPGPTGATGAAGADGAAGIPGVNYRGAWSSVTTYQVRDAVLSGGNSYYATASTTGLAPDQYPGAWTLLAPGGSAGPSGPAATVNVGSVTTGAAGSQASVTNRGTATAAVLDFVIPQGAAGTGSGGGSGAGQSLSGLPFVSTYHAVSYNAVYYGVNSGAAAFTETPSVATWVAGACTANRLVVFSQQENPITVTLRVGASPATMADSGLACSVTSGNACTANGGVGIAAGSFVDLRVAGASGNAAGVWTALECD